MLQAGRGDRAGPRRRTSPMRNGYSFVPCSEPRYLRIRSRRVEVCSVTRWSRTITQSETYSSMPWRVSVPSPRSPVITAVTPRSLSQPNSRRSSERRIGGVRRTRRTASRSCRSRPAWRRPRRSPRRGAGTARRGPSPRPPRSRAPTTLTWSMHELAVGLELAEVEAERRDVGDEVLGGLLERHEHARSRRTR